MTTETSTTTQQLKDKLEANLKKFNVKYTSNVLDHYRHFPSPDQAKLGRGTYGTVFRMRATNDETAPPRAMKVLEKAVIIRNSTSVQHVIVEIACTQLLHHPSCNRTVDLLHNDHYIYMVMELCEGPAPELRARLASYFVRVAPSEIPNLDRYNSMYEIEPFGVRETPYRGDLAHVLYRSKILPEERAKIIIRQVLEALEYLHSRNVVHRDIKTENIVIAEQREVRDLCDPITGVKVGVEIVETINAKLIDFGLAKVVETSAFPLSPTPAAFLSSASTPRPHTNNSSAFSADPIPVTPCGTMFFCAFEAIDGIVESNSHQTRRKWISSKERLPKLDVWGAGCVLYFMLCGCPPFRLHNRNPKEMQDKRQTFKDLRAEITKGFEVVSPNISPEAHKLLLKMLDVDPDQRISASEALADPYLASVTSNSIHHIVNFSTDPIDVTTTIGSITQRVFSCPSNADSMCGDSGGLPSTLTLPILQRKDSAIEMKEGQLLKNDIDEIVKIMRGNEDGCGEDFDTEEKVIRLITPRAFQKSK